MRLVLTGASSFTGYWFARALADAGHEVVAALSGSNSPDTYAGVHAMRLGMLSGSTRTWFAAPFGSGRFLRVMREVGRFDVLCHHRAEPHGYGEPPPDLAAAPGATAARQLTDVLRAMKDAGCGSVVLTGNASVENGEPGNRAAPPHRLGVASERFADALWDLCCAREGVALGRFIIPTPFGPYEERGFTQGLMQSWLARDTVRIASPCCLRDNIHVGLLAQHYARFATAAPQGGCRGRSVAPTGYVESQAAFARRVARETRARTGLDCALSVAEPAEPPAPADGSNVPLSYGAVSEWNETAAWDAFIAYYQAIQPVAPACAGW